MYIVFLADPLYHVKHRFALIEGDGGRRQYHAVRRHKLKLIGIKLGKVIQNGRAFNGECASICFALIDLLIFGFNGQGLSLGNGIGQIFVLIDGVAVGIRTVRICRGIVFFFIRNNRTTANIGIYGQIQYTRFASRNGN